MAENTIITLTSPEGATLNTAGTYCEGNIEVVPKLQSKTATTGEIVTADAGYVGLESVDTNPVYEAGKKSEYDAFWDSYQNYGEQTDYGNAFNQNWNDSNFKPKYDIVPTVGGYIFMNSKISNIKKSLLDNGVVFNSSKISSHVYNTFHNCLTTEIPELNFSSATKLIQIFASSTRLVTIDKLVVLGRTEYDATFRDCKALENLTIEGTIGQNGFNVSWSPLSKASLTSIINALSDTTTGLTVTLRASAVKKAFETSEGANDGDASDEWLQLIATKPNWTINTIDS